MKKQVFDSLEEVFEAFGEDGVIPITYMPQIIFYLRTSPCHSAFSQWC